MELRVSCNWLKFHFILTIFHLISLVLKQYNISCQEAKQIHMQTMYAAQNLQFWWKTIIYTRIKKQELLFYSEPRFNVAAVIGIAKLGVPQSRHVLASWDQRWMTDRTITSNAAWVCLKKIFISMVENMFHYYSVVAFLWFTILSNI